MIEPLVLKIASIFAAGVLTSVSPCNYPTLPLTVGFLSHQSTRGSRGPIVLFFLGQTLAYVVLGFLAVKLGEVFGFTSDSFALNLGLSLLLFTMAAMSFANFMPSRLIAGFGRIQEFVEASSSRFKAAPFFVGFAAAFVASPCTSPVLASVLATVAQEPWGVASFAQLLAYAVGASLLVVLLGVGLLGRSKLPKSGPWLRVAHGATGTMILLGGAYYAYRAFSTF